MVRVWANRARVESKAMVRASVEVSSKESQGYTQVSPRLEL